MKTCLSVALNLMLTLWMLLVGLLMVPFIFLAACWVQLRLRHWVQPEGGEDDVTDYRDQSLRQPMIIEAEKGRDYHSG